MEFVKGNPKEFFEFLYNINNEDNIALLSHDDVDGVVSGLLMNQLLKDKGKKVKLIKFLSYKNNLFLDLIPLLKENSINKIIITDIDADEIDLEGFEILRKEFGAFLVDHHVPNPNLEDFTHMIKGQGYYSCGFIIYEFGKEFFSDKEYMKRLALASLIADYGFKNKDVLNFLKTQYGEETEEDNIFETDGGILSKKINSAMVYYQGKLEEVFNILQLKQIDKLEEASVIIEKEIERIHKQFEKEAEYNEEYNIFFFYFESKYKLTSTMSTIISGEHKDATYVFLLDDINNPGYTKVSTRNQNGTRDLDNMLRTIAKKLENATGGGHIKAAGGGIMKKDLDRFKELVLEYCKSLKS